MPDAASMMKRALDLARRGIPDAFPNPIVGCVLEKGGEVVGEGAHLRFGEAHAEVNAIASAGDKARGATAYVTLEPCSHTGKTGPCTEALIRAGVAKVVWAVGDPNPETSGKAKAILEAAKIAVESGVHEMEARALNAPFFKFHRTGLPWVLAKWAMTLDGKIATAAGLSKWITGEAARNRARRMRAETGCVLVGIGTVIADDPSLVGPPGMRPPKRAVADAACRIPMTCQVVKGAREVETFIGVSEKAPADRVLLLEEAGCHVFRLKSATEGIDLTEFLRRIAPFAHAVFAEGGQHILGSLFDQGLVDEVAAFIAPSVLGGALAAVPVGGAGKSGPALATRLVDITTELLGEDLLVRGRLASAPGSDVKLSKGPTQS